MIVIYGIKAYLNPIKSQLSDVIHGCMQSVLGMPEDKRAHRFIPMDAEDFYYPGGRTPAYTAIEINMMQGRSAETQKALIKTIFQRLEAESRPRGCGSDDQGATTTLLGLPRHDGRRGARPQILGQGIARY